MLHVALKTNDEYTLYIKCIFFFVYSILYRMVRNIVGWICSLGLDGWTISERGVALLSSSAENMEVMMNR